MPQDLGIDYGASPGLGINYGAPAPTEQPHKPSSIPRQAEAGFYEELATAAHAAQNLTGFYDKAVQKYREYTGHGHEQAKSSMTDFLDQYEQNWIKHSQQYGQPENIAQSVARAVGAAPVQLGEYGAAMAGAKKVVGAKYALAASMALVDSLKDADKGAVSALRSGALGAAQGAMLGPMSKLSLGKRVAAGAAMGAGRTALEGGNKRQIETGAIVGGVFGALPGAPGEEKVPLKQRIDLVTKAPVKYLNAIQDTFSPMSRGPKAREAGLSLREAQSQRALQANRAFNMMEDARNFFAARSRDENAQFFFDYEAGKVPNEMKPFADAIKSLNDDLWLQLRQRGLINVYLDNYLPRLYKQEGHAQVAIGEILNRKPIQGSKRFLRARKFDTAKEAMDWSRDPAQAARGIKPLEFKYDNVIDNVLVSVNDRLKLIMAHDWMEDLKSEGLVEKVRTAGKRAQTRPKNVGWERMPDDPLFRQYYKNPKGTPPGKNEIFAYYAPPEVVRIAKNYLGPSASNSVMGPFYDGIRLLNNTQNMFQLGLSAFHGITTGINSLASNTALAMQYASRGRFFKAGSLLAQTALPIAPFRDYFKGMRVQREALKPGSVGGQMADVVDKIIAGGGRFERDQFYRTNFQQQFNDLWKKGKVAQALFQGAFVPFEAWANVLMGKIVPRIKLGTIAGMIEADMERIGANSIPRSQWRDIAARHVDSVDYRLGEVIYDNRLMNRIAKDMGLIMFRSLGWTGGTFELGRLSLVELKDLISKKPELRDNLAFALGLTSTVAYFGAILQIMNGQGAPKELKDYFYPRVGGNDQNGNPKRVHLPDYITRDVAGFYHDWRGELKNKFGPTIEMVSDLLKNEDFYHEKIFYGDQPWMLQLGRFLGQEFLPFSLRQNITTGQTPEDTTRSEFGIMPAPSWVGMSKAERLASDLQNYGGPRDPEAVDVSREIREMADKIRQGKDVTSDTKAMVEQGDWGKQQVKLAYQEARRSHLERLVRPLGLADALKVYEAATPEERQKLKPVLSRKLRSAAQKGQKTYQPLYRKYRELMQEGTAPERTPAPPSEGLGIQY